MLSPVKPFDRSAVLAACADMIKACSLTLVELADHLALPALQQPALAGLVELPPTLAVDELSKREAQALRHCDNPDGANVADLQLMMHISMQTAWQYLAKLHGAGFVVCAKAPGVRAARYFVGARHAQAWVDSHSRLVPAPVTVAAPVVRAVKPVKPENPMVVHCPAPAPAPVAFKVAKPVKVKAEAKAAAMLASKGQDFTINKPRPLAPPKVVHEVIGMDTAPRSFRPMPVDTRFAVLPGEQLTGGFSTSRPGVNPITGKAWGAVA